jgi:glycosyltransferase involved in cell wall biosynthesis
LHRIQACDYYIANTQFEKDVLISHNIPSDKIVVIGSATDLHKIKVGLNRSDLSKKYNIHDEELVILVLSRMEFYKGLAMLPELILKFCSENLKVRFIIAGAEGSATTMLRKFELAQPRVNVMTGITDEQKADLLARADMVILPSSEESFGVVFLEAWAFKKPVIGARTGAIASVISEGVDGLLFDPENVESLHLKILTLLYNSNLRQLMGISGFEKLMKNYTWEIIADKFRQVYIMAINKHKAIYG